MSTEKCSHCFHYAEPKQLEIFKGYIGGPECDIGLSGVSNCLGYGPSVTNQ